MSGLAVRIHGIVDLRPAVIHSIHRNRSFTIGTDVVRCLFIVTTLGFSVFAMLAAFLAWSREYGNTFVPALKLQDCYDC